MAYNGSGTFLINTAGQPVVAGTVISSTTFNSLTADLATGLSTAITKDGQTTVTANIPMASFKFTGLGVGSAAGDSANLSQVQSTVTKLLASVSGADTVTATASPTLAAYAAGQMFYFVAAGDNTTSVTLNIDALGAKAVTRDGSVALAAADIKSGEVVVVVYDGTRFQVVSQLNSAGNATFANVSITSALYVGGVSTFVGNAGFSANVSIASALSVGGVAAITGATTIGGNLTLSGGTANGVLFLNASKVATSGSALTFDGSTFGITSSAVSTGNINSTNANGSAFIFQNSGTSVGWVGNGSSSFVGASASNFGINGQTNLLFGVSGFEKARIDSSGNLGLGVTPSAWSGAGRIIQFGNGAASIGTQNSGDANFMHNAYESPAGTFKYVGSGSGALRYQLDLNNNVHKWYYAASGTANNDISFTQAMTLTAAGEFLINTTTTTGNGKFSSNHDSASTAGASSARIWNQIKNVAASNNATVDVWLGRDAAGNVIGNNSLVGHFNVFVMGASGANAFAGVYSILTTGNGTSQATLSAVSTVTRGTSPVSSIQIAADGASGAIKLTVTYINNAGVVTGGNSQVSFIGQII